MTARAIIGYLNSGKPVIQIAGGSEDAPAELDTDPEPESSTEDPDEGGGDTPQKLPDDHPLVKSLEQWKNEAKELRSKVKDFEDRDKTELQRLTEAKDEAAQAAEQAKVEATRLRMAIKYGLDEDDLDLLGTGDEDEIESRAKRLAERTQPANSNDRTPREALKPGAADNSTDRNDMNALLRAAVRGE